MLRSNAYACMRCVLWHGAGFWRGTRPGTPPAVLWCSEADRAAVTMAACMAHMHRTPLPGSDSGFACDSLALTQACRGRATPNPVPQLQWHPIG